MSEFGETKEIADPLEGSAASVRASQLFLLNEELKGVVEVYDQHDQNERSQQTKRIFSLHWKKEQAS